MIPLHSSFTLPQTPDQWSCLFLEACESGDFDKVQILCQPAFKPIADIHTHDQEGFRIACTLGHLDIVKFLTTSQDLLESGHHLCNFYTYSAMGFRLACESGHLNVVQFFTSLDFFNKNSLLSQQDRLKINAYLELGFQGACVEGHFDVIKFLTTSDTLINNGFSLDIHARDEQAFQNACFHGHLDIVKFLTTSQDLLDAGHTFVNVHADDDSGFRWSCQNERWNVLEFLIFTLNIKETLSIQSILQNYPHVQNYFKARQEHIELQQLMDSQSISNPEIGPLNHDIKPHSSTSFRI